MGGDGHMRNILINDDMEQSNRVAAVSNLY